VHLGLVMECDYRYGTTQEEAFEEAFALMETAETGGLDGVWLAERHFAAPPERAYAEPQASTMRSYQRLAKQFAQTAGPLARRPLRSAWNAPHISHA
jgi:alkanesulfonate monooxygenase SsuD/methylene tetrahydromethanopterin reductase-like flavin-dependent oxidoreductase (luciferase family)